MSEVAFPRFKAILVSLSVCIVCTLLLRGILFLCWRPCVQLYRNCDSVPFCAYTYLLHCSTRKPICQMLMRSDIGNRWASPISAHTLSSSRWHETIININVTKLFIFRKCHMPWHPFSPQWIRRCASKSDVTVMWSSLKLTVISLIFRPCLGLQYRATSDKYLEYRMYRIWDDSIKLFWS